MSSRPPLAEHLPEPKLGGAPVTNIRNTSLPHWRGWLKPERRCLVPANSFSEYAPETNTETGESAANIERGGFCYGEKS
jgi:putative SOS response-associated peptidase YedK